MEGLQLLQYIDNQKVSKTKIASDLGMSRRNLYQLFESKELEKETKAKFESYFKEQIFNGNITTHLNEPKEMYTKKEAVPQAVTNLTESNLILVKNLDRLTALLEIGLRQQSIVHPVLPPTQNLKPKKKKF